MTVFIKSVFVLCFIFQFYSCFNAIFLLFFCCCRHYNCYEDGAKKFTPGFRLGVDYVEDKTWFYHLATCDMFMNDSVKFPIYIVVLIVCFQLLYKCF